MALYEIRTQGKNKTAKVEHDKEKAISWANEKTQEDGTIYEVYEIKHIHLTSKVETSDFEFF